MDAKEKINNLRHKIDDLDNQILDLLVQRFAVSREIGAIKAAEGLVVVDPDREKEIVDRLSQKLAGKMDHDDISAIFGPIYQISKKLQSESK